MSLVRPLSWIGTITRSRDQGLFHLESTRELHHVTLVLPACGSRAFAFSGSYPDSGDVPGQKCHRCEAIAKKERSRA